MNPLEKNVASLETCKKLNWKGETAFVWVLYDSGAVLELYDKDAHSEYENKAIKAPTPTEMLDWLPEFSSPCSQSFPFKFYKSSGKYFAQYGHLIPHIDKSPVEALAKLYKWCEEEGYL